MTTSRACRLMLPPLLLLAPMAAAEDAPATDGGSEPDADGLHNIRFGFERYDEDYELSLSNPLGSGESDRDWEDQHAWFVGYYARVPFITLGLVGTYRSGSDDLPGLVLDEQRFGGRVEGGMSFPILGPLLRIELMPYIGLAHGQLEVDSLFGDATARDAVFEYGIHADALTRIGPVQGGLGIGWAQSEAEYDPELSGGFSTVTIEQQGLKYRLVLGVMF